MTLRTQYVTHTRISSVTRLILIIRKVISNRSCTEKLNIFHTEYNFPSTLRSLRELNERKSIPQNACILQIIIYCFRTISIINFFYLHYEMYPVFQSLPDHVETLSLQPVLPYYSDYFIHKHLRSEITNVQEHNDQRVLLLDHMDTQFEGYKVRGCFTEGRLSSNFVQNSVISY
jgi:hypothetical protein